MDRSVNGFLSDPSREAGIPAARLDPGASLLVDAGGRILRASAAAEKLFFAQLGELTGRQYGFPFQPGMSSEIEILQPSGVRLMVTAHAHIEEWDGQAAYRIEIDAAGRPRQTAARSGNDLLRALVAHAPLAIVVADLSGSVTLWNSAAVRLFGRGDVEMRGQKLPVNCSLREDSLLGLFERTLDGEMFQAYEVSGMLGDDGDALDVEVWSARMNNARGLPAGVLLMLADIGNRKKIEAHIRRLVGHDPLTGLPNRRQFQKQLQRLLHHKKQREMLPILVMQIGLDRFRAINKSLGPQLGDQLLRDVSRRLAESLYETDLLARSGGDEFAVLLRGTHHIQDAARVTERLRQCLAAPFMLGGQEIFVTASIGLAVAPDNGVDAEDLVRAADSAMARAKEQGGDAYQFFTREFDAQARNRLVLENALRHAIERGELFLEYQPQVNLAQRTIAGVEALLRWQHPEMGLIPPSSFVPLAENCGLIDAIGAWVLDEACRQLHVWDRAGLPPLRMAVNVSARQFRDSKLRDQVAAALARHHLAPERLELELTESMLMRNTPEAIRMLERLKALRIHLSIDDFGTGFSSLSYLAELPIDTLKIDQSFVRGADGQIRNGPIVRAICTLAAGLGLRTIAEGVESPQQLAFMCAQQCDEVQGFLLAKPLAPERLAHLIQNGGVVWPEVD